jgi:hypothetical protein
MFCYKISDAKLLTLTCVQNEVGHVEMFDLGEVDNFSKQFEVCPAYRQMFTGSSYQFIS